MHRRSKRNPEFAGVRRGSAADLTRGRGGELRSIDYHPYRPHPDCGMCIGWPSAAHGVDGKRNTVHPLVPACGGKAARRRAESLRARSERGHCFGIAPACHPAVAYPAPSRAASVCPLACAPACRCPAGHHGVPSHGACAPGSAPPAGTRWRPRRMECGGRGRSRRRGGVRRAWLAIDGGCACWC